MSEYQYYEFQAVDRPLSDSERGELRALSTRAQITATSFVNHYEWGDFKGDPARLMERYFDLFLYLANWGSRRFSMRLPKRMLDLADLEKFDVDSDVAAIRATAEHLILDVYRDELDSEDWEDGSGRLAALASLRADILGGDLRVFYLIWLMGVEFDAVPDDAVEPLPGIAPLSASLEAFADFFCIDADLVEAAASGGSARPVGPPRSAVVDHIRGLDESEKVALLVRLYDGDDPYIAAEFRRRVKASVRTKDEAATTRRTVAELRNIAGRLAAERERAERERAEAQHRREEQQRSEAKKRRLDALSARGEAPWRDVERMIELRNSAGYEQAVALLTDLRDLARIGNSPDDFGRRLGEILRRHEKKTRFRDLLMAAHLGGDPYAAPI